MWQVLNQLSHFNQILTIGTFLMTDPSCCCCLATLAMAASRCSHDLKRQNSEYDPGADDKRYRRKPAGDTNLSFSAIQLRVLRFYTHNSLRVLQKHAQQPWVRSTVITTKIQTNRHNLSKMNEETLQVGGLDTVKARM